MTSLGCLWGAFGPMLGSLWLPLTPLVSIWPSFGLPLVPLPPFGVPLDSLWPSFGLIWPAFGVALELFGSPWDPLGRLGPVPSNFKLNVHRLRCLSTKSSLLEHATGAMGATGATGTTGTGEVVSRTAARSPPPTRAGGQDDGSYTNSLKLYVY